MFFCFFSLFAFGVAFPFGFNSTLIQKIQFSKYFFVDGLKSRSKIDLNARARGSFYSFENQLITQTKKILKKNPVQSVKNGLKVYFEF